MHENSYERGNSMTFPLELTQIDAETFPPDMKYLYPMEVWELQRGVEEACDKLEYDGSLMYDEYPDKISVEAMSQEICHGCKCKHKSEISNRWMHALTQMMLCNEMAYRRERRRCHKRNLGKKY